MTETSLVSSNLSLFKEKHLTSQVLQNSLENNFLIPFVSQWMMNLIKKKSLTCVQNNYKHMHATESDTSAKNNNFALWIVQNYSLYESEKVNSTMKRLRGIENTVNQ